MYTLINTLTGEIHVIAPDHPLVTELFTDDHTIPAVTRAPAHPFVMVFQKTLLDFVLPCRVPLAGVHGEVPAVRNLSGLEWKVLLYLLASTNPNGFVKNASVKNIAAKLSHDRSSVSHALTTLTDRGFIQRPKPTDGGPVLIEINPHLAFRRALKNRSDTLTRWKKPR